MEPAPNFNFMSFDGMAMEDQAKLEKILFGGEEKQEDRDAMDPDNRHVFNVHAQEFVPKAVPAQHLVGAPYVQFDNVHVHHPPMIQHNHIPQMVHNHLQQQHNLQQNMIQSMQQNHVQHINMNHVAMAHMRPHMPRMALENQQQGHQIRNQQPNHRNDQYYNRPPVRPPRHQNQRYNDRPYSGDHRFRGPHHHHGYKRITVLQNPNSRRYNGSRNEGQLPPRFYRQQREHVERYHDQNQRRIDEDINSNMLKLQNGLESKHDIRSSPDESDDEQIVVSLNAGAPLTSNVKWPSDASNTGSPQSRSLSPASSATSDVKSPASKPKPANLENESGDIVRTNNNSRDNGRNSYERSRFAQREPRKNFGRNNRRDRMPQNYSYDSRGYEENRKGDFGGDWLEFGHVDNEWKSLEPETHWSASGFHPDSEPVQQTPVNDGDCETKAKVINESCTPHGRNNNAVIDSNVGEIIAEPVHNDVENDTLDSKGAAQIVGNNVTDAQNFTTEEEKFGTASSVQVRRDAGEAVPVDCEEKQVASEVKVKSVSKQEVVQSTSAQKEVKSAPEHVTASTPPKSTAQSTPVWGPSQSAPALAQPNKPTPHASSVSSGSVAAPAQGASQPPSVSVTSVSVTSTSAAGAPSAPIATQAPSAPPAKSDQKAPSAPPAPGAQKAQSAPPTRAAQKAPSPPPAQGAQQTPSAPPASSAQKAPSAPPAQGAQQTSNAPPAAGVQKAPSASAASVPPAPSASSTGPPPAGAWAAPRRSWAALVSHNLPAQPAIVIREEAPPLKPEATPINNVEENDEADVEGDVSNDRLVRKLREYLRTATLLHRPPSVYPRGLINRSNWCYVNATLQALLACPPFYNLFKNLPRLRQKDRGQSCTPVIDSICEYVHQFQFMKPQPNRNKKHELPTIQTDAPFEPENVYKMLMKLKSTDAFKQGRQEDAEEFLTCVLNHMHDELLAVTNQQTETETETKPEEISEESDDWEQVGRKKKAVITRSNEMPRSLVSDIFCGQIRSVLRSSGSRESATLEPFFTLPLDIQNEKIRSVKDALSGLVSRESIQGFTCSKTKEEVEATRCTMLELLPPVLILQLKCFIFDKNGGCQKLAKEIEYTVDLEINKDIISQNARGKIRDHQRSYKLFAVVYHHGKTLQGGHYTTDVYHSGINGWIRIDDHNITVIPVTQVLQYSLPHMPYILYYRRHDSLGASDRSK